MIDQNLLDSIDPDVNYFSTSESHTDEALSCRYITIDEFNDVCGNCAGGITILNSNIRSYNSNSDIMYTLLGEYIPEVLVWTETWFKQSSIKNLPGYNCYHTIRPIGRSGGVSVFIKNNISSKLIDEYCLANDNIEICTVYLETTPPVLLYGIYRPHSSFVENFTTELESFFTNSAHENIFKIVVGDLNVNILDSVQNSEFINFFHTYSFIPIITKPTRFSNNPTLLDQIWINRPSFVNCGIINCDVTDHLPTFIKILADPPSMENLSEYQISFRVVNDRTCETFGNFVREFNWNDLANDDIDLFTVAILDKLNYLYCKACPLKYRTISRKKLLNPWVTKPLKKLLRNKSQYFNLYKMGIVSANENRIYCKKVKKIIDKTKENYFLNFFNSQLGNIKATWDMIKFLTSQKQMHHQNTIKKLIYNNLEYSEAGDIAELFNQYFSNIATDLDREIPHSTMDPLQFLAPPISNSLFLTPATPNEISKVISGLKNTKNSINQIPIKLFKEYKTHYSSIICKLVNMCFSIGQFPNCLKSGIITPIHKQGDQSDQSNYRPITVLPYLSKIIERVFHDRLSKFSSKFSIISPNQFGFLKGKSTADAVNSLTQYLYDCLELRQIAITILIDFKKAFDTINHSILLRKLNSYGIRGAPLNFVCSFLSNRSCSVKIGNTVSNPSPISIGLPQGSILSPLLFLFYINDLPNIVNNIHTILYADDTSFCIKHDSLSELLPKCNYVLEKLIQWTNCNRISININKTTYFLTTNRQIDHSLINLFIDGQRLNIKNSVNFLGVCIDDKLNFSQHILNISTKVSKSIGILNSVKNLLPRPCLLLMYNSLVLPYLSYCNRIWSGTYETHLKPLITLQKRSIRIIHRQDYLAHTNDLFLNSKILKLKDLRRFQLSLYAFQNQNYLETLYGNRISARYADQIALPYLRLTLSRQSCSYSAAVIWNQLPPSLKELTSKNSFKSQVKNYFINSYASTLPS